MKTKSVYIINKYLFAFVLAFIAFACSDDDNDSTDTGALALVSYTPEDGTYIYSNDTIVLTFNKNVRQAEGASITVNGNDTRVIINGNVVYSHISEPLAREVVFDIPEGVLIDRATGEAFAGIRLTYPIEVRKQAMMVVDASGNGDYTSVQDAIRDISSGNSEPYLIFIANGTYEELVDVNKPYVHLIGQDRDRTIITYMTCRISSPNSSYPDAWNYSSRNPSNINNIPEGRDGATVITGLNFYAQNISFENKWGVEQQTGPQAEALHTRADRAAFYNCKFRGFQDTWWTRNYTSGSSENINMRNYAGNCWIEGSVDYIFGGGNLFVENSVLYNVGTQNKITAGSHMGSTRWGYVFDNCTVDGEPQADNSTVFGRAWQNEPLTVFLNTRCDIRISAAGWETMSVVPKLYAEYNTTDASDVPVDTGARGAGLWPAYTETFILDAARAATYTYENVIQSTDGWNPRLYHEKPASPQISLEGTVLTWEDDTDAVCYLIFKNGGYFGKTVGTAFTIDDADAGYSVRAVNRYGSLSE